MKKEARLEMRLSFQEKEKINKAAIRLNMTKTDFILKAIDDVVIVEVDEKHNQLVKRYMASISNNLNQLAKRANIQKSLDKEILEELNYIRHYMSNSDFKRKKELR